MQGGTTGDFGLWASGLGRSCSPRLSVRRSNTPYAALINIIVDHILRTQCYVRSPLSASQIPVACPLSKTLTESPYPIHPEGPGPILSKGLTWAVPTAKQTEIASSSPPTL